MYCAIEIGTNLERVDLRRARFTASPQGLPRGFNFKHRKNKTCPWLKLARSARTCFETPADWTVSHTNIPPRIVSINRGRQDSCAPQRSLPERPTQRPRRSFHLRCASRSRRVRLRGLRRVAAGDDCEQAQAALPHNPVLACSMQLQSIPYGKPPKKSDSGRISNIGNNRRCYAGASEM